MLKHTLLAALLVASVYAQLASSYRERIIYRDDHSRFCRRWTTGFESYSDFTNFDITPSSTQGSAHMLSSDQKRSGSQAHKGLITAIEDKEHIGYPTIEFYKTAEKAITGPVYIEIFVYLDMDIQKDQWVTLAEIATDDSAYPGKRYISVTLGPDNHLQLFNVPTQGASAPFYQNQVVNFPRNHWVNVTIYVDFDPTLGIAAVWQDGALMFASNVAGGQGKISQMHFGLFADNMIPSGVIYNDDLSVFQTIRDTQLCDDGTPGTNFGSLPGWGKIVIPNSAVSMRGTFIVGVIIAMLLAFML